MSISAYDIGKKGERIAARYLKKQGYKILETNKHQSHNEIDIIAANREYIVFAEVKTRSVDVAHPSSFGSPASAVTKGKQRRTVVAAQRYLSEHAPILKQPRMDVIEVYLEKETRKLLKINHIPSAYGKS